VFPGQWAGRGGPVRQHGGRQLPPETPAVRQPRTRRLRRYVSLARRGYAGTLASHAEVTQVRASSTHHRSLTIHTLCTFFHQTMKIWYSTK